MDMISWSGRAGFVITEVACSSIGIISEGRSSCFLSGKLAKLMPLPDYLLGANWVTFIHL